MKEIDQRIKDVCERRGYQFKPWEIPPWKADNGACPFPPETAAAASWPMAQKLRNEIINEIEAEQ